MPEDGGSRVEVLANRHLRGRGLLLWPFFPTGAAASNVRQHLKHFLSSIQPDAGDG
jgi:hypothetical protein